MVQNTITRIGIASHDIQVHFVLVNEKNMTSRKSSY